MLDLSFLVGLALGTVVTGFSAIGSYSRGFNSVRRSAWLREHAARKRAVMRSRVAARGVTPGNVEGAVSKAS